MSMYLSAVNLANDLASEVCKNEKVEKFVSGVTPTVVKGVVNATTGNPIAGEVAGAATSGLAKSHSKEVAEFVVGASIAVAMPILSMVAAPFVIGFVIWKAVTDE